MIKNKKEGKEMKMKKSLAKMTAKSMERRTKKKKAKEDHPKTSLKKTSSMTERKTSRVRIS